MAKRSTIDQIIEWNQRRGRSRIGAELLGHVDGLDRLWGQEGQGERFADFIPIRLATIMEVFVRENVRELIDSETKYVDRTESLTKNLKLDFAILKSLHGRLVTLGDIIAHSLSLSSLAQILSVFSALITDFRRKLPEARECWTENLDLHSLPPILCNAEHTLSVVARIFEVRHIVTHEMPTERPYVIEEIREFLDSTRDFLSATDWILIGETKGDVPRTQLAMNVSAKDDLDLAMREMEGVLAGVRARGQVDDEALNSSQEAWSAYADAEVALHASLVRGGSMYAMIWAATKAEIVRERTRRLRWWLEREEYDL